MIAAIVCLLLWFRRDNRPSWGRGHLSRWVLGGPRLAAPARWTINIASLAVLAIVGRLTASDGWTQVTLYLIVCAAMPLAARLQQRRGRPSPPRIDRTVTWRTYVTSGTFFIVWGTAAYFLPSWGLGAGFWFWLVVFPTLEVFIAAARRDIRRHGGEPETEFKIVRGSAIAGALTAPMIFLIVRFQPPGDTVRSAALAAVECGGIVFLISLLFGSLIRRVHADDAS